MESSNVATPLNDHPSTDALIQTEWVIIKQLQSMLSNPELTVKEKTSAANVLAFHVNTLNKLLIQNGGTERFNEQNLGDYIKTIEPKIARHFRRDFKAWKRALSSRRY